MSSLVLHVVATNRRRGAEIFASALVRSLAELGLDQRVAIVRPAAEGGVSFAAPTAALLDPSDRFTIPGVDPRAVSRLRTEIRRSRPGILQVHGGEALKVAVAARPGIPIVYRRIGMIPPWISSGPRRGAYGMLMRRTAVIVTVAEALRRETIEHFRVPSSRVITIPNGVDTDALRPRKDAARVRDELGIAFDATVTLSLGALVPEKSPWEAVAVMAPLLQARADLIHLFVGDGSMKGEVERRTRSVLPSRSVRFLGQRDDVGNLLGQTDILLFASPPGSMEGMPASLIEAGLCGVPVAGYDVAGVREVVEDGVTGRLARWGDRAGLRGAIAELADDPGMRKTMGREAASACTRFDIRAIAPRYLALYGQVGT